MNGTFKKISRAILESLKIGGIEGAEVAGKKNSISGSESRRSPACFSIANHCEITVEGKKLIGSAQRRLRSAFLQHGSLILDMNPQLTHALLKYSSEIENHAVLESLILNTTNLKQVLKKDLEYNEVAQWFLKGFQKSLLGNWSEGNLNSDEFGLIETFLISEV